MSNCSLKSAACTMRAISRRTGSPASLSCTSAAKEQRPSVSRCGYVAPGASKPVAPLADCNSATCSAGTKRNSASGSRNRWTSQQVAVRLTRIPVRVIHFIITPPSEVFPSKVGGGFSRSSVSYSDDWVHERRPPRGKVTSQPGHAQKQQRDGSEGQRIGRAHSIKQACQQSRQRE